MKQILAVDSDPMLLHTLVGLLKSQGGFLTVFSAANVPATLETLSREEIHILIAGMHMNEMDTFELVTLVGEKYPHVRMIVMTNSATSMFRAKIQQMPSVTHFDQPLDIGLLAKRIFTELQIDYGGQIRGISLAAFLQMLELERQSCTLLITAKGKTGTILVDEGKPVAARMGLLSGLPAIQHILTWQNVWIDIDYAPVNAPREIDVALMNLILESGRMADEKLSQRADMRKHGRFDCLVGVDFRISDWTYQCYLRDISEGGAYVETEQPIKVTQQLIITLSSPALAQSCAIAGTVVRRDLTGIGIRFEALTPSQRQTIRALLESHCKAISPPPSS